MTVALAVVGLETSAGACLLASGDAPCSLCLEARLVEAGFLIESPIFTVTEGSLEPALLSVLERSAPGLASVLRFEGDEVTRHDLLRVPGCARCGGDQMLLPDRSYEAGLLRDPLTGITSILEISDASESATLLWTSVIGRVHMPLDEEPEVARGHGPDLASAHEIQLGEAVERYAALHPAAGRLVLAKGRDLAGLTPPLDLFCGFDEEQRGLTGYAPIDPDAELAWIEGQALGTGERRLVPAASVFHTRSWNRAGPRAGPMRSSGIASHRSVAEARRRALLEVVERFRVVEAWHRRTYGPKVDPACLPGRLDPLVARLGEAGLSLSLRGLALPPQVPSVLAVVTGDVYPWVALGFAARLDVPEAAAAATAEAALLWQWMARHEPASQPGAPPPSLARPDAHTGYWATEERSRELRAELTADGAFASASGEVTEAELVGEVLALAPDAVSVVLGPPDCAACGFEIVRIVAPGLPLLSFGSVGTPRLHAARLGLPERSGIHPFG